MTATLRIVPIHYVLIELFPWDEDVDWIENVWDGQRIFVMNLQRHVKSRRGIVVQVRKSTVPGFQSVIEMIQSQFCCIGFTFLSCFLVLCIFLSCSWASFKSWERIYSLDISGTWMLTIDTSQCLQGATCEQLICAQGELCPDQKFCVNITAPAQLK